MSDKKTALALLPFILILAPAELAAQGYILSWLWEWYVVPLGVSQINVAHALGLALIYNMMSFGQHGKIESKETFEIIGNFIGKFLFGYGLVLLLGYLLSRYV